MDKKYMNKKGLSLSSLTEAMIGCILILLLVGIIIIGMNTSYNQNYDSSVGLGTNDTITSLNNYQTPLQNGLSTQASNNAINGVNVVGSWGMIYAGITTTLNFATGGFIQNAIGLLQLGTAGVWLGWAFRLLFIFGIVWIVIKLLFKVKP
jgi:hypothetical protein